MDKRFIAVIAIGILILLTVLLLQSRFELDDHPFCGQVVTQHDRVITCHDPAWSDLSPLREIPFDFETMRSRGETLQVDLSGSGVRDLTPLERLQQIATIDVSRTGVTDLQSLITQAKTLRTLRADEAPLARLDPVAALPELRALSLEGGQGLRLASLARLRELERLSLARAEVDDLTPLHGLKALREIDLRGAQAPPGQIEALRAALPEATIHE